MSESAPEPAEQTPPVEPETPNTESGDDAPVEGDENANTGYSEPDGGE